MIHLISDLMSCTYTSYQTIHCCLTFQHRKLLLWDPTLKTQDEKFTILVYTQKSSTNIFSRYLFPIFSKAYNSELQKEADWCKWTREKNILVKTKFCISNFFWDSVPIFRCHEARTVHTAHIRIPLSLTCSDTQTRCMFFNELHNLWVIPVVNDKQSFSASTITCCSSSPTPSMCWENYTQALSVDLPMPVWMAIRTVQSEYCLQDRMMLKKSL